MRDELEHFGLVQGVNGLSEVDGGALDGGEGRSEFVADHCQELGPQSLGLHHVGHVLHGDHHGVHGAVVGEDGRGVEQHGDATSVGRAQDDLFGSQRLPDAEQIAHGELLQGDLPPVGAPEGQHFQQLFGRLVGIAQAVNYPPGLAVEGLGHSGRRVEYGHPNRGGVYERLQVGPGAQFLAAAAGVGDGHGGLGGEHDERLFVLPAELAPLCLVGKVDRADADPLVADRGDEQGGHGYAGQEVGHVQRLQVDVYVRNAERLQEPAEVFEESLALGHVPQRLVLLRGQAGDDEVRQLPAISKGGDRAVA